MSRRLAPVTHPVTFELDGESIVAQAGEPVAAAFVAAGRSTLSRSIKYHRPRGPFCFSGGCAHCLVRIDGVPNQYACQVPVKPGMRVERQNAFPDASIDVLRATDFVFSKWFNHHEFLAGVPVVEKVMLEVARKLAGLGLLPEKAAPAREPALVEHVGVAIVGAGAAGLSAARALADRGVDFTLFEKEPRCGGRLLTGLDEGAPAVALPGRGDVRTGAVVVGLFADDGPPGLAVIRNERLHLVFFQRLLLANGGQPTLLTFPNNDLPGVYASRAVSRLIRLHRVLPGARIAVVGEPDECRALARLVTDAGGEAVAVGASPVRAHGLRRVDALTVSQQGRVEKIACDAVALCAPVSPSFELARAAGARVSWNGRSRLFTVEADASGRATPTTWVAGELRGPMSAAASAEGGLVAGQALADDVARGARP
ncbi:MAG: 2Fe-2S iron-sulfur cluster-binding protein [Myxococcaceae bacterium]|nr:2Fe-2S iron-sulfur cluster-binding protein [Myxococcaceae bacterium]